MNNENRDRRLARSLRALGFVYGTELFGAADAPQRERRVHLAVRRAESWVATHGPSRDEERGGSSSPVEDEERAAAAKTTRQAVADLARVDELVRLIDEHSDELELLVERNVLVIDHSKLPQAPSVVGCESCARVTWDDGTRKGGHFEPVREDVKGHRLCDWCYRHALAEANEAGVKITKEHWPPIEVCEIRHRKGPRAAGVELAKRREAA